MPVRWRAAGLCLAGGLLGAAGALLALVLANPAGPASAVLAWRAALGGTATALVVGLPLGYRAATSLEAGLRRLAAGVTAWVDGAADARIPPESGDVGDLARACNTLMDAADARLRTQRRMADADAELLRQSAELAALQERQRIARDLHDAVSQRLFGIHLLAATAVRTGEAAGAVRELEQLSREAQREMRALLLQLRPPALARKPLPEALADLCAAAGRLHHTGWRADIQEVPPLGPAVEAGLYRIAQEAVANVQRHAAAPRASLSLSAREGRLVLAVDDDGCGFTLAPAGTRPGLGLAGMAERAAALGGVLRVKSQPGRGTRVEAVLPLLEDHGPRSPGERDTDGGPAG